MILMRLTAVMGLCEIVPYQDKSFQQQGGGWFPIDNISFGFKPDSDRGARGGASSKGGVPSSGGTASAGRNASAGGGGGVGQDEAFSELQISKKVDMATVDLMRLAMAQKRRRAGGQVGGIPEEIEADIHFVGTHAGERGSTVHTFTFLRIHLELVEVKGWGINGDGDSRPGESLTLGFERAEMCYQSTPDGIFKDPKNMAGFDQKTGDWWHKQTAFYPNFPD